MSSHKEIQISFKQANSRKQQIVHMPKSLHQQLSYMEYKIKKEMKTFRILSSLCGGDANNFIVDPNFQRAFSALNLQEKVDYYSKTVQNGLKATSAPSEKNDLNTQKGTQRDSLNGDNGGSQFRKPIKTTILILRGKKWMETNIMITSDNKVLTQSKNDSLYENMGSIEESVTNQRVLLHLNNYVIRQSKKKKKKGGQNKKIYVLEALRGEQPQQTIRFAFAKEQDQNAYLQLMKQRIDEAQEKMVRNQIAQTGQKTKKRKGKNIMQQHEGQYTPVKGGKKRSKINIEVSDDGDNHKLRKKVSRGSIIEEILKSKDEQCLDGDLTQIVAEQNQQIEGKVYRGNYRVDSRINLQDKKNKKRQKNGKKQQFPKISSVVLKNNICKIILPHYQLSLLDTMHGFQEVYKNGNFKVYHHKQPANHTQYKLIFLTDLSLCTTANAINSMHLYKKWHPQIQQAQIKLKISSENSCLSYQQLKGYSQWYRDRQYLTLNHMFVDRQDIIDGHPTACYIVGRSIQNTNFIPLLQLTRGEIDYIVWKVQQFKGNTSKCKVSMQIKIDHKGLLNKSHQNELSLKYLKGFECLNPYFMDNHQQLTKQMDFDWIVNFDEQGNSLGKIHLSRVQSDDFGSGSEDLSEISNEEYNQDVFYSFDDMNESDYEKYLGSDWKEDQNKNGNIFYGTNQRNTSFQSNKSRRKMKKQSSSEKSEHELDQKSYQKIEQSKFKLKQSHAITHKNSIKHQSETALLQNPTYKIGEKQHILLDSEGLVILQQAYLKRKYPVSPFDYEEKKLVIPYGNLVEKNDWVIQKNGGLKLINKVKMQKQNGVLSYIMKTLKNNIFSGKGITNISLPVDIFNIDSNLQRMCLCMTYGPQFLQQAAKQKDPVARMKWVIAFGWSNSILYADIQKPFNPILGQTYQGYIRGCPVYAEQISHHPPITSIYFIGRGYKVYSSLEAKVNIHLNSGDGINQGFNHIVFDDGDQIIFQTPPAEVSGLAMGDRKFNFKGKGSYINERNNLYCELKMEDQKGFFSKKKRNFIDEISGYIVKVSSKFVNKFLTTPAGKSPTPDKGDIEKTNLAQISGRWPYQVVIDGQTYYDVMKNLPDVMQDQVFPLNSNSNYREDLYYRKLDDYPRSQIQKDRLEVIQRGDRKLREKFHGPAKH